MISTECKRCGVVLLFNVEDGKWVHSRKLSLAPFADGCTAPTPYSGPDARPSGTLRLLPHEAGWTA